MVFARVADTALSLLNFGGAKSANPTVGDARFWQPRWSKRELTRWSATRNEFVIDACVGGAARLFDAPPFFGVPTARRSDRLPKIAWIIATGPETRTGHSAG
jgi:hypothetical protein